ncbi:MAG: hypothetical protein WKH64_12705 [Chloroflexia bacterium]
MSDQERTTEQTVAETNESIDQSPQGAPEEEPGEQDVRSPASETTEDLVDDRDVDQYDTDPTQAEGALDEQADESES